jgi:hypothetical protein
MKIFSRPNDHCGYSFLGVQFLRPDRKGNLVKTTLHRATVYRVINLNNTHYFKDFTLLDEANNFLSEWFSEKEDISQIWAEGISP